MRTKKIYIITAIVGVVCVSIFLIKISLYSGSCSRLTCIAFSGKEKLIPVETYEESPSVFRGLYKSPKTIVRVNIQSFLSQEESNAKIAGFMAQMKGLFENLRSPYPGEISDEIVCQSEYIPTYTTDQVNAISILHFSSYVTNRLTYGACLPDAIGGRAVFAMFYCPQSRQLYQLEWIATGKNATENLPDEKQIIQSIGCTAR